MDLKRKFSLIVIAATAIPCLILGFIAYNISKAVITSNITNNLLICLHIRDIITAMIADHSEIAGKLQRRPGVIIEQCGLTAAFNTFSGKIR